MQRRRRYRRGYAIPRNWPQERGGPVYDEPVTRRLPALAACVLALSLPAAPLARRAIERLDLGGRIDTLAGRQGQLALPADAWPAPSLGAAPTAHPALASWQTIGGCGAGGGAASAPGGGIKWIGRNVTGGAIDAQVLSTQTLAHGNHYTSFASRLEYSPLERLNLALNVPVLVKAGDVAVLGQTRQAIIAGFGDVSLEGSYQLGAIGAHLLMLTVSLPTGSADAVRQGIVLPQHLQLGSGVPGVTGQYELTRDQLWGLLLFGASASYNGWENDIGDYRAPSATAYAHVGYLLDRWVPSAGLTLFGKPAHDRERGADRSAEDDPLFMLVPSVGLEWSNAWIAVLPAATLGLSLGGFESVSVGVGVSSSLF